MSLLTGGRHYDLTWHLLHSANHHPLDSTPVQLPWFHYSLAFSTVECDQQACWLVRAH